MGEELPENFPEFSIMYKTLTNQIKRLEKDCGVLEGKEREEVQSKIQNYKAEILKIKKKFPDNFFKELGFDY